MNLRGESSRKRGEAQRGCRIPRFAPKGSGLPTGFRRAVLFRTGDEEEHRKREQRRGGRRAAGSRCAGERFADGGRRALRCREEKGERAVAGGGEHAVQQPGEQVNAAAHREAAAEEGEDLQVDADAPEASPKATSAGAVCQWALCVAPAVTSRKKAVRAPASGTVTPQRASRPVNA